MVSAGGPQWRGTHDQWLVKRLNPVPVVIGDDFDGPLCGSALLGLKSLPHPPSWVWGLPSTGSAASAALAESSDGNLT